MKPIGFFETINNENKILKNTQNDIRNQLETANHLVQHLKEENKKHVEQRTALENEITRAVALTNRLKNDQESLSKYKTDNEEEVSRLKAELKTLKKEYDAKISEMSKLQGSSVKDNKDAEENKALKEEFKKLQQQNAQLKQQEKFLQSEIRKTRAQAVGLEKICEDFKIKFEKAEELEEALKEAKARLVTLESKTSP